jgi:hypothetical protein
MLHFPAQSCGRALQLFLRAIQTSRCHKRWSSAAHGRGGWTRGGRAVAANATELAAVCGTARFCNSKLGNTITRSETP